MCRDSLVSMLKVDSGTISSSRWMRKEMVAVYRGAMVRWRPRRRRLCVQPIVAERTSSQMARMRADLRRRDF